VTTNLLVLAKEPRPGRVKTRLCPPCTLEDAAELAAAALADTLDAALRSGPDRVVVALDGEPGRWLPEGVEVIPQGEGDLGRRLATAWSQVDGPTIQVGMDTPQLTASTFVDGFATLDRPDVDAVFGPALDGGWWTVGLTRPDPELFLDVPASRPDTGRRQRARLHTRGLRVHDLPVVRDVDDIADARAVAAVRSSTRFARTLHRLGYDDPHPVPVAGSHAGARDPATGANWDRDGGRRR
jgi:uncharacterized protein